MFGGEDDDDNTVVSSTIYSHDGCINNYSSKTICVHNNVTYSVGHNFFRSRIGS